MQSDIATEGNGAEQAADLVLQWWNEVVVSDKTDKTKEGVSNKTDKTDKGKTPQDNTKSEGGMDAGRRDGRAHWTVQMERLKPYVLDLQDTLTVAPGYGGYGAGRVFVLCRTALQTNTSSLRVWYNTMSSIHTFKHLPPPPKIESLRCPSDSPMLFASSPPAPLKHGSFMMNYTTQCMGTCPS